MTRRRSCNLVVIALGVLSTNVAIANCHVGIPDGKVCAKYDNKGNTSCFDVPKMSPIVFEFPFDKKTNVFCTQSGRTTLKVHIA